MSAETAMPLAASMCMMSVTPLPATPLAVSADGAAAVEPETLPPEPSPLRALAQHWPEYLMEAAELTLFMISACVVVTLFEYPGSVLSRLLPDPLVRRVLTGVAMGATATAIIYSPWGQQSGAHFNPSVTLTFLRLGKVAPWDAGFYMIAHFVGAYGGVLISTLVLGGRLAHPAVNYVATVPGAAGAGAAFLAELFLSFGLMSVVLVASNTPRLARYTGVCCGVLVALYIGIEAPLSGMSMNPARTFGPAVVARVWAGLWLYFTAPPLGMLLASEVYLRRCGAGAVDCAKLHHQNTRRCIFCLYHGRRAREPALSTGSPCIEGCAESRRSTTRPPLGLRIG